MWPRGPLERPGAGNELQVPARGCPLYAASSTKSPSLLGEMLWCDRGISRVAGPPKRLIEMQIVAITQRFHRPEHPLPVSVSSHLALSLFPI